MKKSNLKTMLVTGMIALSSVTPAFASGTYNTSKNSSSISISGGTTEFISQKKTEFENEHNNGALVSKQVTVNTQKISANDSTVKIKNSKETSYKNSSSKVFIDIKANINSPIVKGNANVEIENENTTNLNGSEADYVKIYNYSYDHPFYIR